MHELTLAESVITLAEAAARQQGARQIARIRLALGQLAHVEADTLVYCCGLVARDGPARDASYEVIRTPGTAHCGACGRDGQLDRVGDACRHCGSHDLSITGGDDMQILDIAIR